MRSGRFFFDAYLESLKPLLCKKEPKTWVRTAPHPRNWWLHVLGRRADHTSRHRSWICWTYAARVRKKLWGREKISCLIEAWANQICKILNELYQIVRNAYRFHKPVLSKITTHNSFLLTKSFPIFEKYHVCDRNITELWVRMLKVCLKQELSPQFTLPRNFE